MTSIKSQVMLIAFLFLYQGMLGLNFTRYGGYCSINDFQINSGPLVDVTPKEQLGASITIPVKGGAEAQVYIIRAPRPTMKYLFVFHEWWGLNNQIKESAEKYYKDLKDVTVICIDLFDGKTTMDESEAHNLMTSASEDRMNSIVNGAIAYVGPHAQVATLGWSFGGHWALKASLALENQAAACVMFYGMPLENPEELEPLQADVLGIFGMLDGWVTTKQVKQFEETMRALKLSVEIVSFQLGHAFVNPNNPQYNKKAAKSSYKMARNFLKTCYR